MKPEGGEFSHLLDGSTIPASDTALRSIVARSHRHRERRLKGLTATATVIAVAAATVAGISTSGSSRPLKPAAAKESAGFLAPSTGSTSWTKQHRALGNAPKDLEWSAGSKSSAAEPSSRSPAGADICTVDGCPGSLPVAAGLLKRLFVRTVGDVTVRAFTEPFGIAQPLPLIPAQTGTGSSGGTTTATGATGSSSSSSPTGNPTGTTGANATGSTGAVVTPTRSCAANQALVVEVSNPGAVGEVTVPLPGIVVSSAAQPFELIDSSAVGVAESSPIEVVTMYVGPNVASVQASFSDGSTDEMTVVDAWAVLVDDGAAPLPANLTAYDGSGSSVGTAVVSNDDAIAEPDQCVAPFAVEPGAGASGSLK